MAIKLWGLGIVGLLLFILGLVFSQNRTNRPSVRREDWESPPAYDEILGLPTETPGTQASNCSTNQALLEQLENEWFAINIMPHGNAVFTGYLLLQALLNAGLRFGEMNIFHDYEKTPNGKETIRFSVAQAIKPGTFDIEHIDKLQCRGLTLFMKLEHAQRDYSTLQRLIQVAKNLSDRLDGQVTDHLRQQAVSMTELQYLETSLHQKLNKHVVWLKSKTG